MKVFGLTDTGLHRQENEDSFAIAEESGLQIAVVCDGMGGENGGKKASSLAVDTYLKQLKMLLRSDMLPEQMRELSSFCAAQANTAIYQYSLENPEYKGMGTTLVSVIASAETALVSNIGDSRAYLFHKGKLTQITHDHSVVESLVRSGDITAEQARTHPNRNLITRALGPEVSASCDTYTVKLHKGDKLLLCTDGLIVTAEDAQIERTIREESDISKALEALIDLARQNDAPDNVTAVLMDNL